MSNVDKFDTIFKHVQVCGKMENAHSRSLIIGTKLVTVTSTANARYMEVALNGRPLLHAVHSNGGIVLDIGHQDGLHLLWVEVISQPV